MSLNNGCGPPLISGAPCRGFQPFNIYLAETDEQCTGERADDCAGYDRGRHDDRSDGRGGCDARLRGGSREDRRARDGRVSRPTVTTTRRRRSSPPTKEIQRDGRDLLGRRRCRRYRPGRRRRAARAGAHAPGPRRLRRPPGAMLRRRDHGRGRARLRDHPPASRATNLRRIRRRPARALHRAAPARGRRRRGQGGIHVRPRRRVVKPRPARDQHGPVQLSAHARTISRAGTDRRRRRRDSDGPRGELDAPGPSGARVLVHERRPAGHAHGPGRQHVRIGRRQRVARGGTGANHSRLRRGEALAAVGQADMRETRGGAHRDHAAARGRVGSDPGRQERAERGHSPGDAYVSRDSHRGERRVGRRGGGHPGGDRRARARGPARDHHFPLAGG